MPTMVGSLTCGYHSACKQCKKVLVEVPMQYICTTKVTKAYSYYNNKADYDSYIIEMLGKDLLPKYIRLAISVLSISYDKTVS